MTGIRFLLDTNFIIGIIRGNEAVLAILSEKTMTPAECAYSFITRIELLGYQSITQTEVESVESILATMHYISFSKEIENTTIDLRRQHNFKTPDALIAATAKALNLELLTLDQTLAKRMGEILDDDQSSTNSESDRV